MTKILMRSGTPPLKSNTPEALISRDFIGTNSGNLIYAYGIYRNLVSETVAIDSDYYKIHLSDADYINENYDAYIIPLADAIRRDFMRQLETLTKLIKKLTIPVYLIGMGVRAPYDADPKDLTFDFDSTVRDFVKAVLERSSIVGLRGQITAQYLTNLGFTEGKDHIAIGCPSMYTFGPHLKIRDIENLSSDSLITTNLSKPAPLAIREYITNLHREYRNATFIPQGYDEFKLLYSGGTTFSTDHYPSNIDDIQYSTGNPKFFLNAPTWLDFMKTVDFSFGTKLHGNITATIAGTPSITIPLDARMKELAEYHRLTFLRPSDIEDTDSLQSLIDKVDIHSPEKKQRENYSTFVEFLKMNQLNPVLQSENKKTHADTLLDQATLYPPVSTSIATDENERLRRMASLNIGNFKKETKLRNSIKHLEKTITLDKREISALHTDLTTTISDNKRALAEKDRYIAQLERNLNRKSVRLSLAAANKLAALKKKITKYE